ncbi:uncharacterized protein LOC134934612 [Pseudophryne corroboree]|uniref:uncharacterized protein LOC134934612 n=1 Tax=Pseudophryne corroboree TaxID=495146 RepID=UPI0030819939
MGTQVAEQLRVLNSGSRGCLPSPSHSLHFFEVRVLQPRLSIMNHSHSGLQNQCLQPHLPVTNHSLSVLQNQRSSDSSSNHKPQFSVLQNQSSSASFFKSLTIDFSSLFSVFQSLKYQSAFSTFMLELHQRLWIDVMNSTYTPMVMLNHLSGMVASDATTPGSVKSDLVAQDETRLVARRHRRQDRRRQAVPPPPACPHPPQSLASDEAPGPISSAARAPPTQEPTPSAQEPEVASSGSDRLIIDTEAEEEEMGEPSGLPGKNCNLLYCTLLYCIYSSIGNNNVKFDFYFLAYNFFFIFNTDVAYVELGEEEEEPQYIIIDSEEEEEEEEKPSPQLGPTLSKAVAEEEDQHPLSPTTLHPSSPTLEQAVEEEEDEDKEAQFSDDQPEYMFVRHQPVEETPVPMIYGGPRQGQERWVGPEAGRQQPTYTRGITVGQHASNYQQNYEQDNRQHEKRK